MAQIDISDFRVENHGSLYFVQPLTDDSRAHLEENTSPEALWWGGALAVEPRYVGPLIHQLLEAGFRIEGLKVPLHAL